MKLSIIIPCRNEEIFIGECLNSILENEYPKDTIEVLVIDGLSEDKTRDIVRQYSERYSFIKLLDNHKKVTPVAFNIGINIAQGEYILILSSHSKVERNFIGNNINAFNKYDIDCVGGVMVTLSSKNTVLAQSIALAVSHPFGVGNAYFRTGSQKPKYVDTVPFGCYRKEVFKEIGLFDEDLVRNQDDEFNLRLIKNKGEILLVPDIISYYYARDSLPKLWKMYFQYGYFKPLVALKVGAVLTWRQLIPVFFVGGLIISLILSVMFRPFLWPLALILSLYLAINLFFSFFISLNKGLKYLLSLPLVFLALHFSYGIGYLKGICDFIILKKHKRKKIKDVPITR